LALGYLYTSESKSSVADTIVPKNNAVIPATPAVPAENKTAPSAPAAPTTK